MMGEFNLTHADIEECKRARARVRHLEFMRYCWDSPRPFVAGLHTKAISARIDKAFEDYRKGISTYLCVLCCYRMGKSTITSINTVAHFLGAFPDDEVLITSHNDEMIGKLSRAGKSIVNSSAFSELYPHVKISKDRDAVSEWCIEGRKGKAQYISLRSGTSGVGARLCIVDDYFGSPDLARSQVENDKIWLNFTDGVFARLMHPCICMITVTPWSVTDLVGRIRQYMVKEPDFPQFEFMKFPAYSDSYPQGVLFPEVYPKSWFDQHKAMMIAKEGSATFSAMMMCDPVVEGGNLFKIDKINYYDKIEEFA